MTVKEKPGAMTHTRVDTNTLARLRVLAGPAPVAQYLRELTSILASDCPPTLDDLAGGYSLTPIKAAILGISSELDAIQAFVKFISPIIKRTEATLNEFLHAQAQENLSHKNTHADIQIALGGLVARVFPGGEIE